MKIKTLFLFILFTQASASFFDVFRGAVSSVAESFENLMSDVVSDVRETIDCSILAVKQVLSLTEISDSEYDTICKGRYGVAATSYVQNDPTYNLISSHSPATFIPTVDSVKNMIKPENQKVPEMINDAVQNVKDKMSIFNNSFDAHKRMAETKNELEHDISKKLHNELDNLTKDFKNILRGENSSNPTVNGIWQDMKNSNVKDAAEIHHILSGIMSVSSANSNQDPTVFKTPEDKDSNKSITHIADQFEKLEDDIGKTEEIESVITAFEKETGHDQTIEERDKTVDSPLTFLRVAKKLMQEPIDSSLLTADNSSQNDENSDRGSIKTGNAQEKSIEDYTVYGFHQKSKDSKSRIAAVKNFIENSKITESVMSSYFNKAEKTGKSVFDNVNLLNFG